MTQIKSEAWSKPGVGAQIADNRLLKVTWTWERNMFAVSMYHPNNSPLFLVSFWRYAKICDYSGTHILLEFYKEFSVLLTKLSATGLHFI